jgi:4a-hydroxytetrahydrobiopterin dehydratase
MTPIKELAERHCQPLRGSEHKLTQAALADGLAALPGWSLDADGGGITRTFRFPDYHRTLAFVNALAFVAHREDHHPDLGVHYDRVVVRYSTHDVGGLSANDLVCAAKASMLFED